MPKKRKIKQPREQKPSIERSETENSPTLLITAKKTKNQNKISRLLANTKSRNKTKYVWGNNLFESFFQQGGYMNLEAKTHRLPDDHGLIWGNAVNAPSTVMPMKGEGTECNNETEEMNLSSTTLVFLIT